MVDSPKFQPLAGNTYTFKLKYPKPREGDSTGKDDKIFHWYCWGVIVDGKAMNWFPTERVVNMIYASGLTPDQDAVLTATEKQGTSRKYYCFTLNTPSGPYESHPDESGNQPPPQGASPQESVPPPTSEYGGTTEQAPPETDRDGFSDPLKDAPTQGRAVTQKYTDMLALMSLCMTDAMTMTDNFGNDMESAEGQKMFTSEDVRAIAVSVFISMTKKCNKCGSTLY